MGYVDAWANYPVTPETDTMPKRTNDPLASNVAKWFHRQGDQWSKGATVEDLIGFMDAADVEKTLLCTRSPWADPDNKPRHVFQTTHGMSDEYFDRFCQEVAEACQKYPGRLYGTAHIDPLGVARAYRQIDRAITEYGCVGIRMMPAVGGIPIDHPLCWPVYAKCVEHNVPITINVGVPGPMRSAKLQQPMMLDDVLLAFPDLRIVATHVGHPWHIEMVALMQKHPNLSLMTSGWAPKYVPAEILTFMNTRGKRQVMWASDFPLLSVERTAKEGVELAFKDDEVRDRYMRLNCLETFNIG